jgi:hypothetical protein
MCRAMNNHPAADLLITHAHAFTADPTQPRAEAVAVVGSRIAFVGSNADAAHWRGPHTRVINAEGKTLMPGFIDSHFHLLHGSLDLGDIQLAGLADLAAATKAVRKFAHQHPQQEWLMGYGLKYNLAPGEPLTRHHLDAIIANRPLIVFAYDYHTAWANTEALRRAGILRGGEILSPNSEIVMGADGAATGELRESGAVRRVTRLIPPPDSARKRALLKKGLALAAQYGVTSIHNMDGDAEQIALYAAMEDSDELTLRVYVPYSATPATPPEALAEAVRWREQYNSELVRAGAVKFFMDGVIESYTGLLLDDYVGQPGNTGDANFTAEHFNRMAVEADRLGLQIFVHAIGDAAVRRTLDGYEAAQKTNGGHTKRGLRDARHRVEHIELIHPEDAPRFAQLGVIASMQPLHAPLRADGSDVWPERVGRDRWARSFAWQTLREAGAMLAFGSDWPVVSQNPLKGLYAALNRQPWAEGLPHHQQTLAEALIAYTRAAAYAEFQENVKGQLRAGMYADMVLLSGDIFSVPAEAIDEVRPTLTLCDGRIVYER